jgi:hypothetical protein
LAQQGFVLVKTGLPKGGAKFAGRERSFGHGGQQQVAQGLEALVAVAAQIEAAVFVGQQAEAGQAGIGAGLVVAAVFVDVFFQNAQAFVELVVQLLQALALRGASRGGPALVGDGGPEIGGQLGKVGLRFPAQRKPGFLALGLGHEPGHLGQRAVFFGDKEFGVHHRVGGRSGGGSIGRSGRGRLVCHEVNK